MNTELIVPSKETALSVYQSECGLDPFLEKIRKEIDSFVPDVSTKKGREAVASMAYKIAKSKTALDDVGKELVNDLKELPKKIDAERKRVREILDSWKEEVRKPLTDWEQEEEKRIDKCKAGIENIRSMIADVEAINSIEIKERIAALESIVTDATIFEEFEIEAIRTKEFSLNQLKQFLVKREQYESEQSELAKLRAEAAAREQKEREDRIAKEAEERALKAAEEKARLEKETAEKRELELKLLAETAQREKLEAVRREENAKKEAAAREERLKIEAEERQKKAIEDERKAQTEAAAKVEFERVKREHDIKHMRSINSAALNAFITNGMTEECAKLSVSLIAKKLIPNITITY